MFSVLVRPVLEHGVAVWGPFVLNVAKYQQCINAVFRRYARRIIRNRDRGHLSMSVVEWLSGASLFQFRAAKLSIQLWNHVVSAPTDSILFTLFSSLLPGTGPPSSKLLHRHSWFKCVYNSFRLLDLEWYFINRQQVPTSVLLTQFLKMETAAFTVSLRHSAGSLCIDSFVLTRPPFPDLARHSSGGLCDATKVPSLAAVNKLKRRPVLFMSHAPCYSMLLPRLYFLSGVTSLRSSVDRSLVPDCVLCQKPLSDTPQHLLCECSATLDIRLKCIDSLLDCIPPPLLPSFIPMAPSGTFNNDATIPLGNLSFCHTLQLPERVLISLDKHLLAYCHSIWNSRNVISMLPADVVACL
jgi:hypothetical protein